MNTNILVILFALYLPLLVVVGIACLYFSKRLRMQRTVGQMVRLTAPARPRSKKCEIVTFMYRHRVTGDAQAKTFHSICDHKPALDEAFGRTQAPAGMDLVECRGNAHEILVAS